MDKDSYHFLELLKKQISGDISPTELVLLDQFLSSLPELEQQELFDKVWQEVLAERGHAKSIFSEVEKKQLLSSVLTKSKARRSYRWLPLAAAALLLIGLGLVIWRFDDAADVAVELAEVDAKLNVELGQPDVEPGKDRAILLTEEGEQIALDDSRVGILKEGETFNIVRLESGEVQYQSKASARPAQRHTVSTPKGGQINFVLPDGSKVWLNTASSLTFSSDMSLHDRLVDMSGEVYFEVAKSQGQRFLVNGHFGQIDVLGTKFNVNAYDRKQTTTALLEGAVSLASKSSKTALVPGQIALIAQSGLISKQEKANVHDLILWKDGFFHFDRADVHSIAVQLARWYDIEVSVQSRQSHHEFNGTISRQVKLSKMIEMLDYLGLKSKYIDNKLIIL